MLRLGLGFSVTSVCLLSLDQNTWQILAKTPFITTLKSKEGVATLHPLSFTVCVLSTVTIPAGFLVLGGSLQSEAQLFEWAYEKATRTDKGR